MKEKITGKEQSKMQELERLKKYPEVYRHLVGLIKAILKLIERR